MNKNNLIVAILILIIGTGVCYWLKTQKHKENWDSWGQEEEKQPEKQETLTPYQEALASAKKTNKKLFLYFEADWCGLCKSLQHTFDNEKVKKELNKYVVFKIDIDKNKELAKKYNISGIPAYKVINFEEKILNESVGYKSPDNFLKWLSKN